MPLCVDERSVQVVSSMSRATLTKQNDEKSVTSKDSSGEQLPSQGTQLDDDCCWEFVDETVQDTLDLSPFQYYDHSLHGRANMKYPTYPENTFAESNENSNSYEAFDNNKFDSVSKDLDASQESSSQQDNAVPDAWKAEMESLEPYTPNKIFERIDIRPVKGKGRCAFALVDFDPGEIIFVELPVLVAVPSLDQELYDTLKQIHEETPLVLPPMWHLAALYSVMKLPVEKKSILLDKWVPSTRILPSDDVLNVLRKTRLKVDPHMYERFLQVWRFNSFGHHAAAEGLVLYNYISMLSHSCNASASWHYGNKDAFTLRARQKIEKGSEISISYIGDEDLFKSTHVRQEKLSGWLFVCNCERCSNPHDVSRGFRCTSCGVGTVFLRTSKEPTEHVSAEATFSSPCTLCDETPSKDDIRQYINVENAYHERIEELNSNLLDEAELLYAEAQRVFVQHWLLHQLYKLRSKFSEACDMQLKRLDFVQKACPRVSYTLAWLYEELGDLFSQCYNIKIIENVPKASQFQRNALAIAYETAMNMLIILCGSCHDYTLVAYVSAFCYILLCTQQKFSGVTQKQNYGDEEPSN